MESIISNTTDDAHDSLMPWDQLFERFQEMRSYVGWTADDAVRVAELWPIYEAHTSGLVDDFYAEVKRHPEAAKVITGGEAQIRQLKITLHEWLKQLLHGKYDNDYFRRRWHVGRRHVEVGLDQLYTSMALARLRDGLIAILAREWEGSIETFADAVRSLNKLIAIDLAIIKDAYQFEHLLHERERERERGERKLRNLVETADSMIVILRSDRTFAYFSPFAETVTGYRSLDVLNKTIDFVFVDQGGDRGLAHKIESILQGELVEQMEDQVRCRDGTYRWFVWNARYIDDLEEGPSVLAVGYDITELKHANEKLMQADRLATIGEMNMRLAHESRNALQRLRVCTEMLEFEVEGNPEAIRLIGRAQKAQDDLQRLFDEVSNFASPVRLERTPCQLPGLWNESWSLLHLQREGRQTELIEQCGEIDLHVKVDRFRMIQLFRNLFENSLAASAEPVRIVVNCRDSQLEQQEVVEIRVRDNGPGLSAEARRMAFQPFFTTKSRGTGLGLAIAKRIIDAHEGAIAVSNETTEGAEFVLLLPRHPRE